MWHLLLLSMISTVQCSRAMDRQSFQDHQPASKSSQCANQKIRGSSHRSRRTALHQKAISIPQRNWTNSQIAGMLKMHGYAVLENGDEWPLGSIQDKVYFPSDVLPELNAFGARRNVLKNSRWLDKKGNAIVWYYYDTETKANKTIFEASVKGWVDTTCIRVIKLKPNKCNLKTDLGHGVLCVGDFDNECHSLMGRKYDPKNGGYSQKVSIHFEGCDMMAGAHELAHALGIDHEMARSDRDDYIHVLFSNTDFDPMHINEHHLKHLWFQGNKCSPDQVLDIPKPYDAMSIMQYGTSDLAGTDSRAIYIHKNPHYQYMFDYTRPGGLLQSHYDYYIMNTAYNCPKKWKNECEKNGKGAPSCKNFGYLTKACKCACAPGYSGSTCGSRVGPMFPLQEKAKAMLDITEPGLLDLEGKGMTDDVHIGLYQELFRAFHFFTVVIQSSPETRISVLVTQPFKKIKSDYQDDPRLEPCFIADCDCHVIVRVGDNSLGHLRAECISSLVNNELPRDRRVLRSKHNRLHIYGKSFGYSTGVNDRSEVSRMAMEFQLDIAFLERPEDNLTTERTYPGDLLAGLAEAMKGVRKGLKRHLVVVVVVLVAVVLLVIVLCAVVAMRRKKKDTPKAAKDNTFHSGFNPSDSDSSSETSDSSSD